MLQIIARILFKQQNSYSDIKDIDIFPAGLAEKNVPGGILGETFSCIIGKTFKKLREGDRFWFENPGQFTGPQLELIRSTKLSQILCHVTSASELRPYVMTKAS